jgi:hypothetical protein
VILLLDGAPGDAVGAALVMVILVLGAVVRLLVDILRVGWQVVADTIRKI